MNKSPVMILEDIKIVIGSTGRKVKHSLFQCQCGKQFYSYKYDVFYGKTKSCSCHKAKYAKTANLQHGHCPSKTGKESQTFNSWRCMRARCLNENNHNYSRYGGRGITVCDRWVDNFENFLKDMRERPKGMTLDRINNNGNYEIRNCRWATAKQQARNRKKK